jgi:hypothetical protein
MSNIPDDIFIIRWCEKLFETFEFLIRPFEAPQWVRRAYVCLFPVAVPLHIVALVTVLALMLALSLTSNIVVFLYGLWNGENYFE